MTGRLKCWRLPLKTDPTFEWRWPTDREKKLYAFSGAFGIALAEMALVRSLGLNLWGMVLAFFIALVAATLALLMLHIVRLYILHGGSDS